MLTLLSRTAPNLGQVYRVSDRKLLAQCTSTAVVVLNGKAVPMPHADRLRHLVIPTETPLTIKVDEPRPVKGSGVLARARIEA